MGVTCIRKTQARVIDLLSIHRGEWGHFIYAVFQRKFVPGIAAKEYNRNRSFFRVHLPFCIRILQEHKEKD